MYETTVSVLSYTLLYPTVLYCTLLYSTLLHSSLFYSTAHALPHCTILYCTILYSVVLYCTVLYYAILYHTIPYYTLSHALKDIANQRPGLPLHILRYATGSIPLYFPVITYTQQFTRVHLRTSQKPAPKRFNSYEPLRTFPITSRNRFRRFPNTSEDFRRFSENLKKS